MLQQCSGPVPGKFLGIVGEDPSDSNSSRLHVDIFQYLFSFVQGKFYTFFLKWSVIILKVSNLNQLLLKLNRFVCNWPSFSFSFNLLRQEADRQVSKHIRQLTTWQVYAKLRGDFTSGNQTTNLFLWDLSISPPSCSSLGSSLTN